MRLTLLGTGHAMTTACYNTCFALTVQGRHLLVDGGGGSGLLAQAKAAGIVWRDVDAIFCTHPIICLCPRTKAQCCKYKKRSNEFAESGCWRF